MQAWPAEHLVSEDDSDTLKRPILDLKVATIARDVARLCATFRHFPRLWFATLRGFIKNVADDRKNLIHMLSLFFVLRPSATFPDFGPRLWPRLCEGQVQDRPLKHVLLPVNFDHKLQQVAASNRATSFLRLRYEAFYTSNLLNVHWGYTFVFEGAIARLIVRCINMQIAYAHQPFKSKLDHGRIISCMHHLNNRTPCRKKEQPFQLKPHWDPCS
jgi:hypothetical protein